MSLSDQYYSQLREAMHSNKITASDLSQRKGVHYTYVYNTVRKNANITIKTAEELADAAGYSLNLTFVPKSDAVAAIEGDYDASGPIYSARRRPGVKAEEKQAEAEAEESVNETVAVATSLDEEIEALLNA